MKNKSELVSTIKVSLKEAPYGASDLVQLYFLMCQLFLLSSTSMDFLEFLALIDHWETYLDHTFLNYKNNEYSQGVPNKNGS